MKDVWYTGDKLIPLALPCAISATFFIPIIICYSTLTLCCMFQKHITAYHIAQNFGGVKLWQINRFMSYGEENVGEFTIANVSYFSEPGIWLGKILANSVHFAKFTKVFPKQKFALYSNFALKAEFILIHKILYVSLSRP